MQSPRPNWPAPRPRPTILLAALALTPAPASTRLFSVPDRSPSTLFVCLSIPIVCLPVVRRFAVTLLQYKAGSSLSDRGSLTTVLWNCNSPLVRNKTDSPPCGNRSETSLLLDLWVLSRRCSLRPLSWLFPRPSQYPHPSLGHPRPSFGSVDLIESLGPIRPHVESPLLNHMKFSRIDSPFVTCHPLPC